MDMFQGSPAPEVNAMTVRRVFVCSALSNGKISLRQYSIQLFNAAGTKVRHALRSDLVRVHHGWVLWPKVVLTRNRLTSVKVLGKIHVLVLSCNSNEWIAYIEWSSTM